MPALAALQERTREATMQVIRRELLKVKEEQDGTTNSVKEDDVERWEAKGGRRDAIIVIADSSIV